MLPWSSDSRFLGKPDRMCRPSTFCVITYLTIPETKKNINNENQHNQFIEKYPLKRMNTFEILDINLLSLRQPVPYGSALVVHYQRLH